MLSLLMHTFVPTSLGCQLERWIVLKAGNARRKALLDILYANTYSPARRQPLSDSEFGRVKGGAQLVDLDKMLEEKPYTRPKYSPPYWQDVLPKANDRKNV